MSRLVAVSESVPDCSEGSSWGGEECLFRWFEGVLSRVIRVKMLCGVWIRIRLVPSFGELLCGRGKSMLVGVPKKTTVLEAYQNPF
jgi:hypothetical protein